MSILIVEDSQDDLLLVQTLLRNAGYTEILLAESVGQAQELVQKHGPASPRRPGIELILLDILFPESDGIEACRMIKALDGFQDIPVLMVTVKSDPETLQLAFTAGASDYIIKPVRRTELLVRVRSALSLKRELDRRHVEEEEVRETRQELQEAHSMLLRLTRLLPPEILPYPDFENALEAAWTHSVNNSQPLSLLCLDLDGFKVYNQTWGAEAGDEYLRQVAKVLVKALRVKSAKRAMDLIAHAGSDQFLALFPDTPADTVVIITERLQEAFANSIKLPHADAKPLTPS
ncbi:MAG: GGDEF domain-containing response regulator, partial [Nitrospirales bacterium]